MPLVFKYANAGVTQGSEYAWIIPEYARICLIMSWIFLNMPEYAWICLNLSEWLLFYCDLKGNELEKYATIYANID